MESRYPSKDEVLDYLVSSVNLKIWFIWRWLSEHPEEEFKYTFNNRASILQKTVLNPDHLAAVENIPESVERKNLLDSLEHYYKSARQKNDFSSFEKHSMALWIMGTTSQFAEDLQP